ncbi:MAG: fibronectin type III-like domain-contianing protein [Halothiobacillus sp.]|jgi:beta-glucosidase|nr:fibronectin type III-like domain-contianing protein [Halothiobacillus sp.]
MFKYFTSTTLEAWCPGSGGGEAIANILTGKVDPSGHLPITFPRSVKQLPRPTINGVKGGAPAKTVDYNIEGANVGYRWYQKHYLKPLFAFGYGLSYTTFNQGEPQVSKHGNVVKVRLKISNTGHVVGADVAQIYVQVPGDSVRRLAGFKKVDLKPGQSKDVSVTLNPRLLADFDTAHDRWTIKAGTYRIYAGVSNMDVGSPVRVTLSEHHLSP